MQTPAHAIKIIDEPIPLATLLGHIEYNIVEQLLRPLKFFAFNRSTEPNWFSKAATKNKIMQRTKPILFITYGIVNIPEPITVLTRLVIVKSRS